MEKYELVFVELSSRDIDNSGWKKVAIDNCKINTVCARSLGCEIAELKKC